MKISLSPHWQVRLALLCILCGLPSAQAAPGIITISGTSSPYFTNRLLINLDSVTTTNTCLFTNANLAFGPTNSIHIKTNTSLTRWEWRTDFTTAIATNDNNRPTGTWHRVSNGAIYGSSRYEPRSPQTVSEAPSSTGAADELSVRVDSEGALKTGFSNFFDSNFSVMLSALKAQPLIGGSNWIYVSTAFGDDANTNSVNNPFAPVKTFQAAALAAMAYTNVVIKTTPGDNYNLNWPIYASDADNNYTNNFPNFIPQGHTVTVLAYDSTFTAWDQSNGVRYLCVLNTNSSLIWKGGTINITNTDANFYLTPFVTPLAGVQAGPTARPYPKYIEVDGLTFNGKGASDIFLMKWATNMVIRNCRFYHSFDGLLFKLGRTNFTCLMENNYEYVAGQTAGSSTVQSNFSLVAHGPWFQGGIITSRNNIIEATATDPDRFCVRLAAGDTGQAVALMTNFNDTFICETNAFDIAPTGTSYWAHVKSSGTNTFNSVNRAGIIFLVPPTLTTDSKIAASNVVNRTVDALEVFASVSRGVAAGLGTIDSPVNTLAIATAIQATNGAYRIHALDGMFNEGVILGGTNYQFDIGSGTTNTSFSSTNANLTVTGMGTFFAGISSALNGTSGPTNTLVYVAGTNRTILFSGLYIDAGNPTTTSALVSPSLVSFMGGVQTNFNAVTFNSMTSIRGTIYGMGLTTFTTNTSTVYLTAPLAITNALTATGSETNNFINHVVNITTAAFYHEATLSGASSGYGTIYINGGKFSKNGTTAVLGSGATSRPQYVFNGTELLTAADDPGSGFRRGPFRIFGNFVTPTFIAGGFAFTNGGFIFPATNAAGSSTNIVAYLAVTNGATGIGYAIPLTAFP